MVVYILLAKFTLAAVIWQTGHRKQNPVNANSAAGMLGHFSTLLS
jgi:hypothetical protein